MKALFPYSLNRLEYLVRFAILVVVVIAIDKIVGLFIAPSRIPVWEVMLNIAVGFAIRFVCMDIPRCRSMQWSPWLVLLLVVPLVNVVMQILLLTIPVKTPPNTALEPTPTAP